MSYTLRSLALLVGSHQLSLRNDMALDLCLELRLRRFAEIGQYDVERVELVEVAVPADGRASV